MSAGGRGVARQQLVKRAGLIAAALAVLALLFLISGHPILGLLFGLAAVAAIWAFRQMRRVR